MKTEAEVRTFYNLRFLQRRGAKPGKDFLLVSTQPLSDQEVSWRYWVPVDYLEDPRQDWPFDKPIPTDASSWADCQADGLVELGQWTDGSRGNSPFWGIRLTNRARELLEKDAHYAHLTDNESGTPGNNDAKEAGKTMDDKS